MEKAEVISACKSAIVAGQDAVVSEQLGVAFDAGQAGGVVGGFTQADVDAKVAEALAADDVTDQAALEVLQADHQAQVAALQAQVESITSKELLEEKVVADLQASVLAVQASFDAIKAVLFPAQPSA